MQNTYGIHCREAFHHSFFENEKRVVFQNFDLPETPDFDYQALPPKSQEYPGPQTPSYELPEVTKSDNALLSALDGFGTAPSQPFAPTAPIPPFSPQAPQVPQPSVYDGPYSPTPPISPSEPQNPWTKREKRENAEPLPQGHPGFNANLEQKLSNAIQVHLPEIDPHNNTFYTRNHAGSLLLEDGTTLQSLKETYSNPQVDQTGVLGADHTNLTITNTSLQEYYASPKTKKQAIESIQMQRYSGDEKIKALQKSKDQFLLDTKRHDMMASDGRYGIDPKREITGLMEFSNGIDPRVQDPLAMILNIDYYLSFKNTYKNESDPTAKKEKKEEKKLLRRYKKFLTIQQDIEDLKKKDALLEQLQNGKVPQGGIAKKIQSLTLEIQTIDNQLSESTVEDKEQRGDRLVDSIQERQLRQKKHRLIQEKEVYEGIQNEFLETDAGQKAYKKFFHTPLNTNQTPHYTPEKMAGSKGPQNAVKELSKFYKWIDTTLFNNGKDGVPKPQNPQVQSLLMSMCYRGEISPKQLSQALLHMSNTQTLTQFYTAVSSAYTAIQEGTPPQNAIASHIGPFAPVLGNLYQNFIHSGQQWNNPSRQGDKHYKGNEGPLKKYSESSESLWSKQYGFNVISAYETWKSMNIAHLTNTAQNPSNAPTPSLSSQIPLHSFLDEQGNVSTTPVMKQFLATIVPNPQHTEDPKNKALYQKLKSGQWNGTEEDIKSFVNDLKNSFQKKQKLDQRFGDEPFERIANRYLDSEKGNIGTKPMEYLSFIGNELMDMNPLYWGGTIIFFLLSNKYEWLGTGLKVAVAGAIGNGIVEDLTGVNPLGWASELITGNDKFDATNPASKITYELDMIGELKDIEDEKAFTIAGTILGKCNLEEVMIWYQTVKQRKQQNPLSKNIYDNEAIPQTLKNQMGDILHASNMRGSHHDSDEKAKIAFTFFEKFLTHVDRKENKSNTPNPEHGEAYISEHYRAQFMDHSHTNYAKASTTYTEESSQKQKTGYMLAEVMNDITSPETALHMMEDIPALRIMKTWKKQMIDFSQTHLEAEFGGHDDAMKYLTKIATDIHNWGWKITNMTANEIMFQDKTGKMVKIVIQKAGEGKDAVVEVFENGLESSSNWVKKHTGTSFADAWEVVKKGAQAGIEFIPNAITKLNTFIMDADLEAKMEHNGRYIDMHKTVENIGIQKAIINTYGIDKTGLETVLNQASNDASFQSNLLEIAEARGSDTVNASDIVMYFFGSYTYGIGAGVQNAIDITEFISMVSMDVAQGLSTPFGDEAKGFLKQYSPDKLGRIFPRDNIDGREHFREYIRKKADTALANNEAIIQVEGQIQQVISDTLDTLIADIGEPGLPAGATPYQLQSSHPLYAYAIGVLDRNVRTELNNMITDFNTSLSGSTSPVATVPAHVPLLDRWTDIPDNIRKQMAQKFLIVKEDILQKMQSASYREEFFRSIPGVKNKANFTKALIKEMNIHLKSKGWKIK